MIKLVFILNIRFFNSRCLVNSIIVLNLIYKRFIKHLIFTVFAHAIAFSNSDDMDYMFARFRVV
jgi:hypothetical protein